MGGDDYTEEQNGRVTVIVHIEGERGVENLDAILDVDGIDMLFLGPYDISKYLGIPGQVRDERVEDLMSEVCERAEAAGKVVGMFADDAEMANQWIDTGVQYVARWTALSSRTRSWTRLPTSGDRGRVSGVVHSPF
ncbi:aldolase/citrate lyase family protein [Halarchaeum salinum]|uniref:HpcH/HpaI aldolase/citrate lyase domain-containing protein n=1 Tax=Halarchaeum salinum TaxID=489912 RepID=A0AAV3SAK9_9EURY